MRALDWLIATLSCLCLAASASAADPDPAPPTDTAPRLIHEVRIGVMAHDVDGLWSGQHKEKGVDYSGEVVFGHSLGQFGAGVIRPNLGFDLHNRGDTSKAYGGLLWHWDSDRRVSFEFGLGAALHSGERQTDDPHRKQLGSRFLFRIPIELGYAVAERQRVSLFFEHCSNAWLAHENEGMDLVGARWAYQF
jgi:lipid A 3-O-deacylase